MERKSPLKLAAWAACSLAGCLFCQNCAGQDIAASASAATTPLKTIVLKDGGVLVGKVTQSADRYVVTRAGSEIQIAASNVLFIGDSLEEAYRLRRNEIESPDAVVHLQLADWCLRYNLVSQAARELADARQLEPLHPRLALLDRRLAAANQARARSQSRSALPPSRSPDDAKPGAARDSADLVTGIDDMPDGALERFTRKVQPILVNNCTTSGCHQNGGARSFQLDRSLLHGPGNQKTTMQNLKAALALVDRGQPHLSPLLTIPRAAHGGMDRPIFGPRQNSAFAHLVEWVALVSSSEAAGQEANSLEHEVQPASFQEAAIVVAAASNPEESTAELPLLEVEAVETPITPVRYGARPQHWQPKDPFDPEIFNRAQRSWSEKNTELQLQQAMPTDSGH